jgi:AcrR family transcriptional regulator
MSKREASKQERRARILAAARKMILDDTFSMRALSEKADVSVATAYSLFGSRQRIVAAIFEEDLVDFEEKLRSRGKDAVDRMFGALALAEERFHRNPDFVKAMFRAIYGSGDPALSDDFMAPRIRSWEKLVLEASTSGLIDATVNVNALAKNMFRMFIGSIQDWSFDNTTLQEMHSEVAYGLSLILMPIASRQLKSRLRAHFVEHDAVLRSVRAAGPSAAEA